MKERKKEEEKEKIVQIKIKLNSNDFYLDKKKWAQDKVRHKSQNL